MEFEFNSNDGAAILARGETGDVTSPSFGPGDGDAYMPPLEEVSSEDMGEEGEVEYTEDFFEYPAAISERMVQVTCDLDRLREALALERRCLFQESEEVAALKSLDARRASMEYEETASAYEPRDSAYLQAERRRQDQALVNKERYMRHMLEVEKMCSEEFTHLKETRAKVDRLNHEISDWRLTNGSNTGFGPFPIEVMRVTNPPCHQAGGASATIPGRFTVNQPITNAGPKSVPNVTLPVADNSQMLSSNSFDPSRPWVQTFAGAVLNAPRCARDMDPKEGTGRPQSWRSGDVDDRMPPVLHF